jgi:hypothetical protein
MKLWIAKLSLALALVSAGYFWGHYSTPGVVHAQTPVTIPKAWGHCVGSVAGDVILEDNAGNIRFVSMRTGRIDPEGFGIAIRN